MSFGFTPSSPPPASATSLVVTPPAAAAFEENLLRILKKDNIDDLLHFLFETSTDNVDGDEDDEDYYAERMEFEEDDEEGGGEGGAAVPSRVGLDSALVGALLGHDAAPADDDGAAAAVAADDTSSASSESSDQDEKEVVLKLDYSGLERFKVVRCVKLRDESAVKKEVWVRSLGIGDSRGEEEVTLMRQVLQKSNVRLMIWQMFSLPLEDYTEEDILSGEDFSAYFFGDVRTRWGKIF